MQKSSQELLLESFLLFKNLLVRNIASGVLKYDHKHFKATRNATTSVKSISSDGQKLSYTTGKDKSNLFVNKSLNTG